MNGNGHLVSLIQSTIQRVEERKAEILHITRRSNEAYVGIRKSLLDLKPVVARYANGVQLECTEVAGRLELLVKRALDNERWNATIAPQRYTHINEQTGGLTMVESCYDRNGKEIIHTFHGATADLCLNRIALVVALLANGLLPTDSPAAFRQ